MFPAGYLVKAHDFLLSQVLKVFLLVTAAVLGFCSPRKGEAADGW